MARNTKSTNTQRKVEAHFTLSIQLESKQAELLATLPWFNQRFLLPGEAVNDYDVQFQLLIDSIEVHDALDLILVKDIHEELRDVQRMRAVRRSTMLNGMIKKLVRLLDPHYRNVFDDPLAYEVVTAWEQGTEEGTTQFNQLLEKLNVTLNALQAGAFELEAKHLKQIDDQFTRHEKNIRETIKMIDIRRNHKVMRKRLEFDLQQDERALLESKSNGD